MSQEDQTALDAKIAEGEKRVKSEKKAKRKKEAQSFWSDFKKFITRGNIVDMAIGVIVGGAFTAIVTALSNQIIKPLINWILAAILGQNSLSEIYTFLKRVEVTDANGVTTVDLTNSIYIDWGAFINAILNFLIIAMCLFLILRIVNRAKKKFEQTVNAEKLAAEKAAADKKAAEEKAAADAKAAAEATAAAERAEAERQFYENVRRQTELLEQIAEKTK